MSYTMQKIMCACILAAGCATALAGSAAAADATAAMEPQASAALSPVARALSGVSVMNGEANMQADYYIYVQSASWCGPCKLEMPVLVKLYPEMKAANVELILVGLDGTEPEALKYLQSFSAPFPGVHFKAADALPGFTLSRTVPHATVVNKQGEVIAKGHGSLARKWLQIITADQED